MHLIWQCAKPDAGYAARGLTPRKLKLSSIIGCVAFGHNVWLVLVAAGVCVFGCWVLLGLFERALQAEGRQRVGWQILAAMSAGASIWCTHFVAVLAYDPGAPVSFEPQLTISSAMVATFGAALALMTATAGRSRAWAPLGGALLGLAIGAMHYSGMLGYRIAGLVEWRVPLLLASLAIGVGFSAAALHVAVHGKTKKRLAVSAALLVDAIIGLHFTGIAALKITPLDIDVAAANGEAAGTLAIATVGMTLLILGTGLVSYLIDLDVRADSRKRQRELALHDGLTKLPNRNFFLQKTEALIAEAKRAGTNVAIVIIDVNALKEVNDQYGHASGDAVLKQFAERLLKALSPWEFVARLGGDEFAVAQISRGRGDVASLAERLAAILRDPIIASDFHGNIGASMGAAIFPDDSGDIESLLNNAALAMHRAKAERSAEVFFYQHSMDEQLRAKRRMAAELRAAINNNELEVHYQPQASCESGRIIGMEALARWPRPDGFTPPDEFIPVAEQYGLIDALGDWVLRRACSDAARWDPPYKVAVNLSPVQLRRLDLPQAVEAVLKETGLPATRLELELTESALIRNPKSSMLILRRIRDLGITVALDDFGTGHSSLSTLRAFPFDRIKLDRSFLREIETSDEAEAVLDAVLGLGRGLGIPVLTEGVETQQQLDLLSQKGCAETQGYFIGRPAPMSQLVADGVLSAKPASGRAPPAQAA
jgi:diguanylate cyclase (GGDEF)-like protein